MWVKRVARWRDSGLTLKEFAAEVGVNANTLAGWRWRLRAADGGEVRGTSEPPSFLEIVAPSEAAERSAAPASAKQPAAEPFELILSGGQRVRVPVQFDGRALRRLVDALEAR